MAECREGGGTHIDPGNHPAPRAPSSSLRATATRPPPCSRSFVPPYLPPFPLALPSFSRTTFCVPAMLSVLSVYVVVGVKTLRRAGYPQVRCTSNARVLPISFLDCKLSERAVLPDAETIRLVANCTRRTGYV